MAQLVFDRDRNTWHTNSYLKTWVCLITAIYLWSMRSLLYKFSKFSYRGINWRCSSTNNSSLPISKPTYQWTPILILKKPWNDKTLLISPLKLTIHFQVSLRTQIEHPYNYSYLLLKKGRGKIATYSAHQSTTSKDTDQSHQIAAKFSTTHTTVLHSNKTLVNNW